MAAGLLLLAAAGMAAGEPAPPTLRVGKITIRTLNVFSTEEASSGWLYRSMNRARVRTRPAVIRKFLLFREGDPYDPAKLQETERNLRALPFIKASAVTAGPAHDGVVDVMVVTQDTWTLLPGLPIASNGGTTTFGLQILELDILGTGRELSFSYEDGPERLSRVLAFSDPYLLGAYWSGRFSFGWNSDGNRTQATVSHPFSSLTSTRSHTLDVDFFGQTTRTYAGGDVDAAYHQDHKAVLLELGWALGTSEREAHRLVGGVEIREDRFRTVPDRPADPLPDPRTFRYVFAGYEHAGNDLVKLNYVNRDLRVEDFNLGLQVSVRAGFSPSILGVPENTAFVRLAASKGVRLGEGSFALARASYETRLSGGPRNEIVSASLEFVRKLRTHLPKTLVAKIRYDQGWNLDRDVQFLADGLAGLRGYRLYSFAGDKRVILNVEQRLFRGRELLHLASPGAVFFVDTGMAVPNGTALRPAELKTDVGFGLRMAIDRAPTNNVYRIDFAYALNRDPKGRRGLLVSFSASQGF